MGQTTVTVFVVLPVLLVAVHGRPDFSLVKKVLEDGIQSRVTPGLTAMVASAEEILFLESAGSFTYGSKPPFSANERVTSDTLFDMASLTKVLVSTTAVMQFFERGELDTDWNVADEKLLGSNYGVNGKQTIKVENLLLHNAGYPPDPSPLYSSLEFGCPATLSEHPPLVPSCHGRIYDSLLNQTLVNPVGSTYVYSDLSFITIMFIVGRLAHKHQYVQQTDLRNDCPSVMDNGFPDYTCYYEAYIRKYILEAVEMKDSGFLPRLEEWSHTAPTWTDSTYRKVQLQGQVSDENAYANGGISGHAGFFSNIKDVAKLLHSINFTPKNLGISPATVELFVTPKNLTQSSRALGWDTNTAPNTYKGCGSLSAHTFTHTGYTGTEVCNDRDRGIFTILLTNRCFPDKTGQMDAVHSLRVAFNSAVASAIPLKI